MTVLRRISQLEARQSPKRKYLVVMGSVIFDDTGKGPFRIQPLADPRGGRAGEPFYLQTRKDLEAFETREDVSLIKLHIGGENGN
jgi:hypothetical protein